ncbi:MAG TPA: hypothetical protein VL326_04270 [Kofleriaceae bacterium]|nr:hypothetical protein [Kofleriaceae bacterium]
MRFRRVAGLAACGVVAAACLWWIGGALAQVFPPGMPIATQPQDAHLLTLAAQAGRHWRIDAPRGPIHVWVPPGYRAETAATILYIHGYYDDADTAYIGHRLPEQFAMSALNAMFIVVEAPYKQQVSVNYPNLSEVLRIVEDTTGVTRGMALTAAVGHSGAFRTINEWLDEPLLDQLVMIDAMYANEELIEGWLKASPRHRLITVGEDTLQWNEQFARDTPETFVVDRVPPTYNTWPPQAKTARVVYVRAQYYHMPLVMDGIVLPGVLRLLPVELLATEPWQQPLGAMPPYPDAAIDAAVDGDTPGD